MGWHRVVDGLRVAVGLVVAGAVCTVCAAPAEADPSAPDAGFGQGGVVIEDLGAIETGGSVVQLSDDKLLLLGGGSGLATGHAFSRYLDSGTIDSSYGNAGTAAGRSGTLWGFTLLADDSLLVASDVDTGSLSELNDAAVVRYTAAGVGQPGFGTDGRVVFRVDPDNPADEHATGVIELSDGSLAVCGWVLRSATNTDLFVMRLSAAGEIDTTFGDNGRFFFDFQGGVDKAWQLHELPGGGLVVYGEVEDKVQLGQPTKILFLRLDENGALDPTFGTSGVTTVLTDVNSDAPGRMIALPGGDFLFAIGGTAMWTAGRLKATGVLDPDFGTAGIAKLAPVLAGVAFPLAQTSALAVQSDGRVVVAGRISGANQQFQLTYEVGVARFDADGSPDTTFNSGSAQRNYTITEVAPESVGDVIVQRDGKIVVGGYYPNGSDDRFMLRLQGDEPISTSSTTVTTSSTSSTTSTTLACPGPPECDVCGDANGDGSINATDALTTLRAAVALVVCRLSACDVNGDGRIVAGDALLVLQYAVGLPVTLACGA